MVEKTINKRREGISLEGQVVHGGIPNPPVYEARPLVQFGFLGGEGGREIDQQIKTDYKGFPAVLEVTRYEDGRVKGSTPHYAAAAAKILRALGLGVATLKQLSTAQELYAQNPKLGLNLMMTDEDPGLVLRNGKLGRNKHLAQRLIAQIRKREPRAEFPIKLDIGRDVELVKDQDSPYGLSFELTESATPIYAPVFAEENNRKTFFQIDENSLPVLDENEKRMLYTSDEGLSKLNLYWYVLLDSHCEYLDSSGSGGRVVVVSDKAASQNLDQYILQLQEEK